MINRQRHLTGAEQLESGLVGDLIGITTRHGGRQRFLAVGRGEWREEADRTAKLGQGLHASGHEVAFPE